MNAKLNIMLTVSRLSRTKKIFTRKAIMTTLLASLVNFGISTQALADTQPQRIISAGSAITEIINALGANDELIAVDVTSRGLVESSMPKVGYHRQLSAESLMSLSPSRIIGSDEMGPPKTLALLKQSGIEVDIVNSGETVSDLLTRIDQVATLTGHSEHAEDLKQQVTENVEKIRAVTAKQTNAKKVLFLMIHDGRPVNVAGSKTTADAVITLAGAINPAAKLIQNYKPVSMEAIVEMQPDIILLSSRTTSSIANIDALLEKMPMLAATPAGQNKAMAIIDGTALIGGLGIHSIDEATRLNHVFYP